MVFEVDKIRFEYEDLVIKIVDYKDIFGWCEWVFGIIQSEFGQLQECYLMWCCIEIFDFGGGFFDIDLIVNECLVVLFIEIGYFKWMLVSEFEVISCGICGKVGICSQGEDVVKLFISCNDYDILVLFSDCGVFYVLLVYCVFQCSCVVKGILVVQLLFIFWEEVIIMLILVLEFSDDIDFVMFI